MQIENPIAALVLFFVALLTISVILLVIPFRPERGHYETIDGLRGYLAFSVFLCHSIVWYNYLKIHQWVIPPSNLFNQFGVTSVALFFMTTAFLFYSKLLYSYGGTLDWVKLYTGRVFRIVPLYMFMMIVVLLIVFWIRGFQLYDPIGALISKVLLWMSYIKPNINYTQTSIIIAGVIWSLPYEWLFYSTLAFVALLFFKIKTPALILVVSIFALFLFSMIVHDYYSPAAGWWLLTFFGGITATFLRKRKRFCALASSKIASVVIVALLLFSMFSYQNVFGVVPLLCTSLFFVAVACGNNLFGLLTWRVSMKLGQISYSIYLLHGILYFVSFNIILRPQFVARLSPVAYWGVVSCVAVLLLCVCTATYHFIEYPFQHLTGRVSKYIRSDV